MKNYLSPKGSDTRTEFIITYLLCSFAKLFFDYLIIKIYIGYFSFSYLFYYLRNMINIFETLSDRLDSIIIPIICILFFDWLIIASVCRRLHEIGMTFWEYVKYLIIVAVVGGIVSLILGLLLSGFYWKFYIEAILSLIIQIFMIYKLFEAPMKDEKPFILDEVNETTGIEVEKEGFADKKEKLNIVSSEDNEIKKEHSQSEEKNKNIKRPIIIPKKYKIIGAVSGIACVVLFLIIVVILALVNKTPDTLAGYTIKNGIDEYSFYNDEWVYNEYKKCFCTYSYENLKKKSISYVDIYDKVSDKRISVKKIEKTDSERKDELDLLFSKVPLSIYGYYVKNGETEYKIFDYEWLWCSNGYFYRPYTYRTDFFILDGILSFIKDGETININLFKCEVEELSEEDRLSLKHDISSLLARKDILKNERKEYSISNQFIELKLEKERMNGREVKYLQEALLAMGYVEVGDVDGYFGPKTEEAFKNFQKDSGVDADGIFTEDWFEYIVEKQYSNYIDNPETINNYYVEKTEKKEKEYNELVEKTLKYFSFDVLNDKTLKATFHVSRYNQYYDFQNGYFPYDKIVVPKSYEGIPVSAVVMNGGPDKDIDLYDEDIYGTKGVKEIIFPEGIDTIAIKNFYDVKALEMPSTMKYIGIQRMNDLENLVLNDGLKEIVTLSCNPKLKEIIMPDTVTYIGNNGLIANYKVKKIKLSKNLKTIPNDVFTFRVMFSSGSIRDFNLSPNHFEVEIPKGFVFPSNCSVFNGCGDSISLKNKQEIIDFGYKGGF